MQASNITRKEVMTILKTKRLILRPWKTEDLEPFAALNADPRVMEYYPSVLSREESDRFATKIQSQIEEKGWGLWAVALPGIAEFIGYVGLQNVDDATVEIGWRLAFEYWGKGYATEGALECLQYAFKNLNLQQLVSFTSVQNMRSRAVMERIGMQHDPKDDFNHPRLPEGHPLQKHVLYRIHAKV